MGPTKTGSRRGPNQGEGAEGHVDRSGVDSLAQRQVDTEILHGRVEKLFHGLLHPVDLVNK